MEFLIILFFPADHLDPEQLPGLLPDEDHLAGADGDQVQALHFTNRGRAGVWVRRHARESGASVLPPKSTAYVTDGVAEWGKWPDLELTLPMSPQTSQESKPFALRCLPRRPLLAPFSFLTFRVQRPEPGGELPHHCTAALEFGPHLTITKPISGSPITTPS